MKEGTIPPSVMFVRLLQVGLIAFSIYSVSKFLNGTSQALDFALNRPVSEDDQKRTLVNELPRFFFATDPNAVVAEALENEDYGLAGLYINYAQSLPFNMRGRVTIEPALVARFEESQGWYNWGTRQAKECFNGLIYRTADTASALGCQAGSNFFLIGDAADLAKEGLSWANGAEVDEVIVGLSLVGAGSSIIPMLYPAAGGAGIAKSVVKAGAKTYPIAKPMRVAVRNAVDFPVLKTELSTAFKNAWWPWQWRAAWKNVDYGKVLRPKHADALVSGMGNMVVIGKNTGPDVAIRTFKQVDSFDDLASLTKISKVAGDAAPNVLGIMGKNAPDFMKLAKPAVAYAKLTYKSSLALWGIAVAFFVVALEYALRRTMWNKLKASNVPPAPFWGSNGMGIQGLKTAVIALAVLVGAHFALHLSWESEKSAVQISEREAAESARLQVYLAQIYSNIQSNVQHDWYVESGMNNLCRNPFFTDAEAAKPESLSSLDELTALEVMVQFSEQIGSETVERTRQAGNIDFDFEDCSNLVDNYLQQWPIKI